MAIVGTAQEREESPQGDIENLTRSFLIKTDDLNDGPVTLRAATGMPKKWDTYSTPNESTEFARAQEPTFKRLKPGSKWWIGTVRYKVSRDEEEDDQQDDPTAELPEVSFGFEEEEFVAHQGGASTGELHGRNMICNSAGEPFDPPPMMKRGNLTLTISKNQDINFNHITVAAQYMNTVNSDEARKFWGQWAGTVFCRNITGSLMQRRDADGKPQRYVRARYEFIVRPTWKLVLLDQGTYYWSDAGVDKNKVEFKSGSTNIIGLLDGDGGAVPTPWTAESAVYLDPMTIYNEQAFSNLGLPNNFLECKARGDGR